MKLAYTTAMVLTAALAAGCSTKTNLTLVSTKNVDLSAPHKVVARGAESTNGRVWLLFIPLGPEPNALEAANKILEKNKGDYLSNVEVETGGFSLLAISFGSVTVKGDVYQRVAATPAVSAPPPAEAPEATDTAADDEATAVETPSP